MGRCEGNKSDPELKKLIKKIERKLGAPNFNSFCISPVKEGYIQYTDLIHGGLTIFDLEQMNNAINYYAALARIVNEPEPIKKDGSSIR